MGWLVTFSGAGAVWWGFTDAETLDERHRLAIIIGVILVVVGLIVGVVEDYLDKDD